MPVFANDNTAPSDIDLAAIGVDGVTSAEGQLYNTALVTGLPSVPPSVRHSSSTQPPSSLTTATSSTSTPTQPIGMTTMTTALEPNPYYTSLPIQTQAKTLIWHRDPHMLPTPCPSRARIPFNCQSPQHVQHCQQYQRTPLQPHATSVGCGTRNRPLRATWKD